MKKYVFKPYNSIFPSLYENEKQRLCKYLTGKYQIEHFGSTAIPGLGGKGIIDIYISVPEENHDQTSKQILNAGYRYGKTPSNIHHHIFHKIELPDELEGIRTYHVHLSFDGQKDWVNALTFRDYLQAHPEYIPKYVEIKQKAANESNEDKDIYMQIKSPFIQEILKKALEGK